MSVCEQREAWLLARTKGIGGSDIAAVVGLSPFKRPIDIFIGKTQAVEFSQDMAEHLQWGNLLEPVIRAEYARRSQMRIACGLEIASLFPGRSAQWDQQTIVCAEERPWMLGTPDGIHLTIDSGLEIKNAAFKGDGWGTPGSDEVPDHYAIQCQWYMAVTGMRQWDLAVLFNGNTLETYRLFRNDELLSELIAAGEAFWNDNVLKAVPPPLDESESYAKYLGRKYSLGSGSVMEADEHLTMLATTLASTACQRKAAEDQEQLIKNMIAERLQDAAKAIGPFGSVNWVRPKQGSRTNWEAVAAALNPPTELIAEHTSPIHNTPYIRLYPKKEK